jgi:hypothetical protein
VGKRGRSRRERQRVTNHAKDGFVVFVRKVVDDFNGNAQAIGRLQVPLGYIVVQALCVVDSHQLPVCGAWLCFRYLCLFCSIYFLLIDRFCCARLGLQFLPRSMATCCCGRCSILCSLPLYLYFNLNAFFILSLRCRCGSCGRSKGTRWNWYLCLAKNPICVGRKICRHVRRGGM